MSAIPFWKTLQQFVVIALTLMSLLLLAHPAVGGSWNITYEDSGTITTRTYGTSTTGNQTINWSLRTDPTTYIGIGWGDGLQFFSQNQYGQPESINVMADAVCTWMPSSANDLPPSLVVVGVYSNASINVNGEDISATPGRQTVSDGFNDLPVITSGLVSSDFDLPPTIPESNIRVSNGSTPHYIVVHNPQRATQVKTSPVSLEATSAGAGYYENMFCDISFGVLPAPNALSSLQATVASSTENDLSWAAVAAAVSYNVYRSTDSSAPKPWAMVGSSSSTNYQDTNLTPSTQYFYYVTAVDQYGQEGGPSNVATATTYDAPTADVDVFSSSEEPDDNVAAGIPFLIDLEGNPTLSLVSGTKCKIIGRAGAGSDPKNFIYYAAIHVNGTEVNHKFYDPPVKNAYLTANVDTTSLQDGKPVTVDVIGFGTTASTFPTSRTKQVYNNATVLGNAAEFPINAPQSVLSVANILQNKMKHTINPLPAMRTQQKKLDILGDISNSTVFYTYTHASHYAFGDCYANYRPFDANQWIYALVDPNSTSPTATVSGAIGFGKLDPTVHLNVPIPPYNLVFIDGCRSAKFPDLAYAFGVANSSGGISRPDAAYLGWDDDAPDDIHYVKWTKRLWNDLGKGMMIGDAVREAKAHYQPQLPANTRGIYPGPVVWGDGATKMHGVYKGTGLTWFKPTN